MADKRKTKTENVADKINKYSEKNMDTFSIGIHYLNFFVRFSFFFDIRIHTYIQYIQQSCIQQLSNNSFLVLNLENLNLILKYNVTFVYLVCLS